ncbi:MAG: PSD1 and planctomycete cytochrome C domain-containing protein [Verrucomicrobiota bacterium]
MSHRCPLAAGLLLAGCVVWPGHGAPARGGGKVDFQRDIRPVLSDVCFHCHGPDNEKRKAKLRLDTREGALADRGGYAAVVPGKPAQSELVARITSTDPEEKMPPPESGRQLTPRQIELLKQWVAQGAEYQTHWAFVPPQRPELPAVKLKRWPRNGIDHFVLARLEHERLKPSIEADKATLIRRVTLDLTGLPPTPEEVERVLADKAPNAYERLVDDLLRSPRYGERMAADWLDAARYADTNGYQVDDERAMWPWRNWVIHAFNDNLPFDRFTIEQLAGDLLPEPTLEQKIATGFNRNHRINGESGVIPEEYRVEYVADRVDTTSTVWLGLTMGCARCHDHKYDPITQKEFYQFFAFFNNVPENGLDGRKGNATPLLRVPMPTHEQQLADFDRRIAVAEARVQELARQTVADIDLPAATNSAAWTVLEPIEMTSLGGVLFERQPDHSILSTGKQPRTDTYTITAQTTLQGITGVRLELLADERLPKGGPGRHANGNPILSELLLTAAPIDDAANVATVTLRGPTADFSQEKWNVANAIDGTPSTGWAIHPEIGKSHAAVFQTETPIAHRGGTVLRFKLDQNYGQGALLGRFRLAVTTSSNPTALPPEIADLLALKPGQRTPQQVEKLVAHFGNPSPEYRKANAELEKLRKAKRDFAERLPTTMVMEELASPRDTFMLIRGAYDKPGAKVGVGVPASLNPLPDGAPTNRLGLAQWLVSPMNPLTARVIVNRYWQAYFGAGIVRSSENFGSQAELPSHPELLDWLATEFIRTGWNVKAMQRLIVTSATYRQSSKVPAKLVELDAENRLLARGPRLRLPAEMIRDQALAVSGLLSEKIGGPSVRPYQPAGLWEEVAANPKARAYVQDTGEGLYRRSLYTFWRRTVPPPTMATFDAPAREVCSVQRLRTSTPLQALALMNDVTYVEAARALAQRMMTQGGATASERITFAFRLATARPPEARELKVLLGGFEQHLVDYRNDTEAAAKLIQMGASKPDTKLNASELAAYTAVASLILNLDEVITKE